MCNLILISPCLPALQMAFMWLGCRGSWKTMTLPSCPCKEVGLPHSLSWVPADMSLVTDSDLPPSSPPQVCGDRMPPREERVVGVVAEVKGGSGICEGGGVVVRWPAEPMQQEVNCCDERMTDENKDVNTCHLLKQKNNRTFF